MKSSHIHRKDTNQLLERLWIKAICTSDRIVGLKNYLKIESSYKMLLLR